jgi:transcriptional regulator with XRE-family HTH domain
MLAHYLPHQRATISPIPATLPRMARLGRPPKLLAHPPNRIREVREALGLSPKDVAKQLGRGENWLTRLETGDRDLKVYDLERIAKVLGVSACSLLTSVDPVTQAQEREILEIFRQVRPSERDYLLRTSRGLLPETPGHAAKKAIS